MRREVALDAAVEQFEALVCEQDWRAWLRTYFPHASRFAHGKRHVRLWEWIARLRPGVRPRARLEVWPRGSGKSTVAELACVRLAETLQRRFALYVSDTQDQANKHVATIAAYMEQRGLERAVSRYGRAKAWNQQQLRTATGFSVVSFGLDAASRGIKIEQYRPDFIILDDIDRQDDSQDVVRSNIETLTTAILPTGSPDCAVLFVQNYVHADSVMRQLVDGRIRFLRDRDVPKPEPAIEGMEWEEYTDGDGNVLFRIVGGRATWEGQDIRACEDLLNTIDMPAFLRECQHDVRVDPRFRVFDTAYLERLLETVVEPKTAEETLERGCAERYACGRDGLAGVLDVWERPVRGVRYVIGVDVAEGLKREKADESDACVLREDNGEQVGHYYGQPDPKGFAVDLLNLSEWYNRAELVVENNAVGLVVIAYLEDMGANLWYNDTGGQSDPGESADENMRAGFRTTARSKGLVDGELRVAVVEAAAGRSSLVLRSRKTIEQMVHYVYLGSGGRGGEGNWHDDAVRSVGLAWYVAKEQGLRSPYQRRPEHEGGNQYGGYYRGRRK